MDPQALVEPSPTARFAVMIRAVSAGRAMLRVAVRAEQPGSRQMDGRETELVDESHIQVGRFAAQGRRRAMLHSLG